MRFFIHYRPSDGEILGWSNSYEPVPIPGQAVAFVAPFNPNPLLHKFDGARGIVVEKNADEKRASRQPTRHELEAAVFIELLRTDHLMVSDYPLGAGERQAWLDYRQGLRALSRLAEPAEMVDAWPAPPDGSDPVSAFRERLKP